MMPVNPPSGVFARLSFARWPAVCVLLLFLLPLPPAFFAGLPSPAIVRADEEPDDLPNEVEEVPLEEMEQAAPRRRTAARRASSGTDELSGVYGRMGHYAFRTFGRKNSITHVELVPFALDGNDMIFGDARFFLDNEALFGGNLGAGYRQWVPGWQRVLGGSVWYDFDQTSGNNFHQTGLSLESYGRFFDARANGYIPVGDNEQDNFNTRSNLRYQGNQIVFDYLRSYGQSMPGFDVELGFGLPGEFAQKNLVRFFGGYYHFLGEDVADIDGYKGRIEGRLMNRVDLQVQVTDDNAFGTNVNFGVAFNFGPGKTFTPQADTKLNQMTRYVNRNYNIIVTDGYDNSFHQAAINPATGQAYNVAHVSSTAGGSGAGTQTDPFASIALAQAANPDLILVHSGSVFNSPVVLAPNQRILGEGVNHFVMTQNGGNLMLPSFTGGSTLPVLQGNLGDAVTLAAGAEFSGFNIQNITGNGIVGQGMSGATVRNVNLQNVSGHGIYLDNASGAYLFEGVNLSGIGGPAFHVNGGTSEVQFAGRIENGTDRAVLIENTTAGTINLENSEIFDNGGSGILLANNAGNVRFGNVDLRNSTSSAIDIQGGTGQRVFAKSTVISNSAGPGVNIENAQGRTDFNQATITQTNGSQGIRSVNSATTTAFANLNLATTNATAIFSRAGGELGIFSGSIAATNGSAVDVENTNLGVDITSLTSTNATTGVRIINGVGTFMVRGNGAAGSGGSITGADTAVLLENFDSFAVQSMTLDGNTNGITASNTGEVVFYYGEIKNTTNRAFDLLNVRQFELFTSNIHDNGGNDIRAQVDTKGSYSYTITNSVLDNKGTSPVVLTTLAGGEDSTLSLNVGNNIFNTTAAGSRAVDIDWNGVVAGTLTGNIITGKGSASTGFDINTTSTSQLVQIGVGQNKFTFEGDNSTAIAITTSGPSEIGIGQNQIVFNAAGGVGANFNIGGPSTINIFTNAITDNVSRGTGLLFSSITGTSEVTINNNNIQLLSTDNMVDRGIIFNPVTGDVQLKGTQNNIINGATTPFSAVGTTGSIFVNGVQVP